MERRDFIKAGVVGAGALGLSALPMKTFAKKPDFKLRLQSFLGPGWLEWDLLLPRYIQRVKNMTDGRVEIKPFPPGALVATFNGLDACGKGVVDMVYAAQVYWKGMFPFCEWTWGVPFAFSQEEHLDYLWNEAGMLQLVREAFATKNVFFISAITSDEWGSTLSTKPIRSLADFKGLKIRTFSIAGEIWKMNGAGIVHIPGEELYTGLSTGVIDACNWGSPYGMYATRLHEVAKWYCEPCLIEGDMEDMNINMDVYKSMPKDVQESLYMATRVFSQERRQTSTINDCIYTQKLKDAGVQFTRLPDSDLKKIRKLSYEILAEKAKKDELSGKAIKIIQDVVKKVDMRPRMVRGS